MKFRDITVSVLLVHESNNGEMAERSKVPPWKGGIGET